MFRTAQPIAPGASSSSSSSSLAAFANSPTVARHSTHRAHPKRYPQRLNFYNLPPIHEVTIDQFESWAIDRLKVLAEIESSQARNRSFAEIKEAVNAVAKKHLPLSANTAYRSTDLDMERMKDHVSHFVLRLAFCRSEDLRRRFVKAESILFRLRYESDDTAEREDFLTTLKGALNLDWTSVNREEMERHRDQLLATHPKMVHTWESERFVKVEWTRVLDLVEKRRVFMRGGMAWVPVKEQSSLIFAEFQARLAKDLETTARALPRLDEDDRLLPVLSHLSMGFLAGISNDYSHSSITADGTTTITASMVDSLVRAHAPLCMRHLHATLSETGHLRHYGRLQFNLFLKELGLPIDEALLFWRRSFRNMSDDKFNKEHRYNIRHGYGLEGRRLNYPAKSCARILTQDQPGPQDSHGCPLRHFSPANLATAMATNYGLASGEQAEVLAAVKAGHYHVGCTRLFEMTHRQYGVQKGAGLDGQGESVAHPNRYFERSWRLANQEGGANTVDTSDGGKAGRETAQRQDTQTQKAPGAETTGEKGHEARDVVDDEFFNDDDEEVLQQLQQLDDAMDLS
ncbi:DNA primase subunit pri2 [Thecaphora frezii]